jgi:DNA-binding transcriptional LysR family regulator
LAELARRHPKLHVHAAYSDHFIDLVGAGFDAAVRVFIEKPLVKCP